MNDSILNFIDFSESDTVYVDADGNEMVCQESSDTYALCTHSMIPATFLYSFKELFRRMYY